MEFLMEVSKIPSVNGLYGRNKNGTKRLSKGGSMYKQQIHQYIRSHALDLTIAPNIGYVVYIAYILGARMSNRDLDNLNKCTIDSIFGALGINDNRVYELHTYKQGHKQGHNKDYIKVKIEPGKEIDDYYIKEDENV